LYGDGGQVVKLTTAPTFLRQSADSPIGEFALRLLVEFPGGETHVIGTATVVTGHLVLTARHNLEDVVRRFGATERSAANLEVTDYALRLIQILPGPRTAIWNVCTAWTSPDSDLALLHLALHGQTAPVRPIEWRGPYLRALPPPVGSVVAAFGYHSSKVSTTPYPNGTYHLDLKDEGTTATGVIEEILPSGQPSGRFNFPCYRVAARFDAGMSGGPVFDEQGLLCGIISGTYGSPDGLPLSYVATLWPMLRIVISGGRPDPYPKNATYPVIDLALNGLVHVIGLEDVDPAQFPGRRLPVRR
jgi:Trypsin-like peptidase domain